MQNLFDTLKNILSEDKRFVTEKGEILRNAVYEAGMKMDKSLLKMLLSNAATKEKFFQEVEVDGNKTLVFDKVGFGWVVSNKEFLPDSYTRYKNKIGLVDGNGQYISNSNDVELVFPYKDCVLVGGQTKEDQKRNEIFFNKTLAPDEVDRLLASKVLVNAKRYTKDGVESITSFDKNDNLIIKGNNLLALESLLPIYEGQVKCIYIDVPYNTANDTFQYNDRFTHSTWLTFMKNRLEIAKKFLRFDGTIWLSCDDNEGHYLKVFCDEIFGRENFINTVLWQKIHSTKNDAKYLSDNHDFILVYAKNKNKVNMNLLSRTEEMNARYLNPDNDPRGPWASGDLVASGERKNGHFLIKSPTTNKVFDVPTGKHWVTTETNLNKMIEEGKVWFGVNGDAFPRKKRYLSEVMDGRKGDTWWEHEDVGHNQEAKRELIKLFNRESAFATPKPERLIQRILTLATDEYELVMDFFAGSGTTGAVAQKMNRNYILVEQMEYTEKFIEKRLQKVILGENGGISQSVNWQGGGSFVYCELAQLNQKYVDALQEADTDEKVTDILKAELATGFISDKVNPKLIDTEAEDYKALSLDEKKAFVMEVLDSNLLYVNYSDIDDKEFAISDADKAFTKSFYGEE